MSTVNPGNNLENDGSRIKDQSLILQGPYEGRPYTRADFSEALSAIFTPVEEAVLALGPMMRNHKWRCSAEKASNAKKSYASVVVNVPQIDIDETDGTDLTEVTELRNDSARRTESAEPGRRRPQHVAGPLERDEAVERDGPAHQVQAAAATPDGGTAGEVRRSATASTIDKHTVTQKLKTQTKTTTKTKRHNVIVDRPLYRD